MKILALVLLVALPACFAEGPKRSLTATGATAGFKPLTKAQVNSLVGVWEDKSGAAPVIFSPDLLQASIYKQVKATGKASAAQAFKAAFNFSALVPSHLPDGGKPSAEVPTRQLAIVGVDPASGIWAGLVVARNSTHIYGADGVFGFAGNSPLGHIVLEGHTDNPEVSMLAYILDGKMELIVDNLKYGAKDPIAYLTKAEFARGSTKINDLLTEVGKEHTVFA